MPFNTLPTSMVVGSYFTPACANKLLKFILFIICPVAGFTVAVPEVGAKMTLVLEGIMVWVDVVKIGEITFVLHEPIL